MHALRLLGAAALVLGACAEPPPKPAGPPAPGSEAAEMRRTEALALRALSLATSALDAKRPGVALLWARRAAELNPKSGGAKSVEGAALTMLGRHREAHAAFTAAIALRPDDPLVHANRARSAMILNDAEAAEADFTEAIRLAPDRRAFWEGRAEARAAQGDRHGADADLQVALQLDDARAAQDRRKARDADVQARIEAR